jgi:hypothetical protein
LNPIHFLRRLRRHPIYLREHGYWGRPNPLYDRLLAFSPLILFAAIFLGFCSAGLTPFFFSDTNELLALYCLICLPNALISIVSLYGAVMAPALTVPAVAMERNTGTWEILRVTPFPAGEIAFAKLFGALSRLRIWTVLFFLSAIQAASILGIILLSSSELRWWSLAPAAAAFFRPALEIAFAGVAGYALAIQVASDPAALSLAYTIILLGRLVNNTAVWLFIFSKAGLEGTGLTLGGLVAPVILYLAVVLFLIALIIRRADQLTPA